MNHHDATDDVPVEFQKTVSSSPTGQSPGTVKEGLDCHSYGCSCSRGSDTHCPAHDDKHPSLSITEVDGKTLWKCHAGCSQEAVTQALVDRGLYVPKATNGVVRDNVTPMKGVTRTALAKAKGLDTNVLDEWGVRDVVTNNVTKVMFPYPGIDGIQTKHIRYRTELEKGQGEDKRFTWKSGSNAILYGMQKLPEIAKRGWGVLAEGETDTLAGWSAGVPVIGIPGKGTWRHEWAEPLTPDVIPWYLWVEPGARDLAINVAEDIPNIRIIVPPAPLKDIAEASALGMDVAQMVDNLKRKAVSIKQYLAEADEQLRKAIDSVLRHSDPVELVKKAMLAGGYGGDISKPMVVYFSQTSRLLRLLKKKIPVHLLVSGQSSAGKNAAIDASTELMPPEIVGVIAAGSPTVLIHGPYATEHAVIVFGEADSLPAGEDSAPASAVRSMLQDGEMNYDVTERDKETGKSTVVHIHKPGPTVLITTSTKKLGPQMMTRFFDLEISGGDEQINAVLDQIVINHHLGVVEPPKELVEYQRYLQSKVPWDVDVPFLLELRRGLPKKKLPTRITRDFHRLISFIQSIAILRHAHRATDDWGRLVASLDDYETAYNLVNSLYIDAVSNVTPAVTEIVSAVEELKQANPSKKINYAIIGNRLGTSREQAKRDALKAVANGWLVDLETKKGSARDLVLGDPMPSTQGLPTPESMRHAVTGVTARDDKDPEDWVPDGWITDEDGNEVEYRNEDGNDNQEIWHI